MARAPEVNSDVADVLAGYPPKVQKRVLALRAKIFAAAAATEGVGELEETLKWGEPAYLTSQTGSGTTIRLGWKPKQPSHYAMYVHCQTNLIEGFREAAPAGVSFEGNRAIVFDVGERVPDAFVRACITEALTYHLSKRRARARE